jgi:hypothetical protein
MASSVTSVRAGDALAYEADAGAPLYTAHDVEGMAVLTADSGTSSLSFAIAGKHWLIVAPTERDLARLGPYAYRTMPTKVAPGGPAIVATVPQAALAGPVSAQLSARWETIRAWLAARDDEQRAKHGGRAPDFGDPRAILDAADAVVKRRIAFVSQATAARVEVSTQEGGLRADAFVTPGAGEAGAGLVASMHPGDARPLAELPAEVVAALLTRQDAASRMDDARELEAALDRALGSRAHPEDTAGIHGALDDWARARGDWMTAAVAWGRAESAHGLLVRTPATGEEGASRAVRELVDLSHRAAFGGLLSGAMHLAPATVAPADVPSVSRASLARFGPQGADAHGQLPSGVAWGIHDGDLLVAAGGAATGLLAMEAKPARRLGDDPRVARLISGLGADVAAAVIAQPLRFDPVRSGSDDALAPAALAWGRQGSDAWLRVELAAVLLRELIRMKAGL